jgi:molecular chaperone DnaK (HSP70)
MRLPAMGMILLAVVTVASAQTTSTTKSALVVIEANSPALRRAQVAEPIGLETLGGAFTPILKAGCSLPCEATNTFSTAVDKQAEIKISLEPLIQTSSLSQVILAAPSTSSDETSKGA